MEEQVVKRSNMDIYLLGVIFLLVASLGGGLWIIGKSLDVRLDEMAIRMNSQTGQVRSEIFSMRKDVDEIKRRLRAIEKRLDKIQPPPPPKHPGQEHK